MRDRRFAAAMEAGASNTQAVQLYRLLTFGDWSGFSQLTARKITGTTMAMRTKAMFGRNSTLGTLTF
jgi:hypothetical protein